MKMVWSPEKASKAYLDTLKSIEVEGEYSGMAELVSAMAAGWNMKFIVETWSTGDIVSTSIGLSIASNHTQGKHVIIVPDEKSSSEYSEAMRRRRKSTSIDDYNNSTNSSPQIIIGETEEVINGLMDIDCLVVDCQRIRDFDEVLRHANFSSNGAILVCKNSSGSLRWRSVLEGRSRQLVRSVFLPVGKGLDIAHVGGRNGSGSGNSFKSRWFRHVDKRSGEEYVFRR